MTEEAEVQEQTTEQTTEQVTQEAAEQTNETQETTQTIAAGAEERTEEHKPYWPEDWREKAAEHVSAGDSKAREKELRRLQNITDPAGLYGMYREAEGRLTSGGLVKIPNANSPEEEKAAWRRAREVPEEASGYVEKLDLGNDIVLGDADKELVNSFAEVAYEAGMAPNEFSGMVQHYFKLEEQNAAAIEEADEDQYNTAISTLKEEWGPAFTRNQQSIPLAFRMAEGGMDMKNDNAVINRLLGGRTSDGVKIGNDPAVVKWLYALANELEPAQTVMESGSSGKSLDDEIKEIKELMRTNPDEYYKDENKYRQRLEKLYEAQQKQKARTAA